MDTSDTALRTMFMQPAIEGCFRSTANGWVGVDAILQGLEAIEKGESRTVTFALATNVNAVGKENDRLITCVTVGRERINGTLCWRYNPGQPGSHAICASGEDQSITRAAAVLSFALAKMCGADGWVWRQPDPNLEGIA